MITKRDILSRIKLRQSTINDYLSCPLLFKYRHLDGIRPAWRSPNALHGSPLHKMVFLMHRDKWNMRPHMYYRDIFADYELEREPDKDIPVFWKDDREKMLAAFEQNAVEIIEGYRRNPANQEAVVWYAETGFRVKIAGYTFTGTLDQVRRNADGTVELIDFKSNQRRPTEAFLFNDWQLSLYTYALRYGELKVGGDWLAPRLLPDYSSWYFLRAHEVRKRTTVNGKSGEEKGEALLRSTRTLDDLRGFRKDVANLLKAMLKNWYAPNPNHCALCPFTQVCTSRHDSLGDDLIEQAKRLLRELEVI